MKILIEIDTDTHRVVPVSRLTVRELPPLYADEGRQEQVNSFHYYSGWNDLVSILAAAPQPEPVAADLRRDAELWRAHQKRKQDLIDRGFLRNPLRAAPQVCIAEIVTIDAAVLSKGEQK